MRDELRRWAVFNLIGTGGFVLQLGAVSLLTSHGWPALTATIVALELAIVVNFCGHARWTWRQHPVRSVREFAERGFRYQASKSASVCIGLLVTAVAIWMGMSPGLANVLSVVVCAGPNYFTDRLVFTSRLR